jgi:Ca2+-binding EF-hand superfamily protein
LRDCQYIINYFDIDGDGALSYTEFMQMILPCDNLHLRSEASQRMTGKYDPRMGRLAPSVERSLTDFLEREINLHLKTEGIKVNMKGRYDWNLNAAFSCCDTTQEGYLNGRNIQTFLRLNGHFASDEEIIAIVRRMDADAD